MRFWNIKCRFYCFSDQNDGLPNKTCTSGNQHLKSAFAGLTDLKVVTMKTWMFNARHDSRSLIMPIQGDSELTENTVTGGVAWLIAWRYGRVRKTCPPCNDWYLALVGNGLWEVDLPYRSADKVNHRQLVATFWGLASEKRVKTGFALLLLLNIGISSGQSEQTKKFIGSACQFPN